MTPTKKEAIMISDPLFEFQTPTSKQSKYKEQVAELRKGRNSGLQKEQKEKHMVPVCLNTFGVFPPDIITCESYISSFKLPHRPIDRSMVTPESLCWRTSPVTTIWSSSGKPKHVHLKIW